MVRLQTSLEHKFGQTNNLPFVGKVQISSEGIIEVPDMDTAIKLAAAVTDFVILDTEEQLQKQTEENDLGKTEEDELGKKDDEQDNLEDKLTLPAGDINHAPGKIAPAVEGEANPTLAEETAQMIEAIKGMKKSELRTIAADSYPTEEWDKLNIEDLKSYLIEKLQTSNK